MSRSVTDLARAMAAALDAGQAERVVELAARTDVGKDGETVLELLGRAQQQTGRHAQAAETFERLSRMQPQAPAYWKNLGIARRQAGDIAGAERALLRAQSLAPGDPEVHFTLGQVYARLGRWPQARDALLHAVQLVPGWVDARLQAAHVCNVCGDHQGEEAMLEGAEGWPPQPAAQALALAALLAAHGKRDGALGALAQARLPEEPTAGPMRLRIAAQRVALYERSNQLEHAQRALLALPLTELDALPADAIQARADGWRVHAVVAMRVGQQAEAARLYRRILGLRVSTESRANAAFGLAKACDRQGRHADAWAALEIAHATQLDIVRDVAPQLIATDSQRFPLVDQYVDRQAHAAWQPLCAPDAQHSPVFVIGFMRSGTTLLEQMLDAHPDFQSMGERGFIFGLIDRIAARGQTYPAALASLTQTDADQLRAAYWQNVKHALPERGERTLVDKNPLNMLCLPLIQRLFPAARIILCLRHPCDVLLSCMMQPFRSPALMVMCSSLPRLARSYVDAFEQCYRHLEVLQPCVLEWCYESAVSEFDRGIKRVGRFLGIADTSAMADFAQHARCTRFIGTPSYARVTEPVNRAAVGRWEAYREQFEPVLPVLRPWIERFGYGTL